MKIYLDAGHGPDEPGAVNGLRKESTDNRLFVDALTISLYNKGYRILPCNRSLTSIKRAKQANELEADLYLSFHRNSFVDPGVNGIEVYGKIGGLKSTEENFAAQWLTDVAKLGFWNRGIKFKDFNVLTQTKMPAILFEIGFISNKTDNEQFDKYHADIVKLTADLIVKYYPLSAPAPHWAQQYFDYLENQGAIFSDTRFNDVCTRGEMFAALAKIYATFSANN